MAHAGAGAGNVGIVGGMYASGVRGLPGGAAFTLTGVLVDRITPRLMRMAGAARATARGMNAITPSLQGINNRVRETTRELVIQERLLAKYQQQMSKLQAIEVQRYSQSIINQRRKVASLRDETAALYANARAQAVNLSAASANLQAYAGLTPVTVEGKRKGRILLTPTQQRQLRAYEATTGASILGRKGQYWTSQGIANLRLYNIALREHSKLQNKLTASKLELSAAERELTRDMHLQNTAYKVKMAEIRATIALTEKEMAAVGALVAVRKQELVSLEKLAIVEQFRANSRMYAAGAAQTALRSGAMLGVVPYAAYGLGSFASMQMSSEYSQELSRLRAVGGYSASGGMKISGRIQEMAGKYAMPASGMLGGATVLSKAGIREETELFNTLQAGIQLSIINGVELESVLTDLLTITYAYNLERTKTLEIAANEQKLMNASLLDFGDYIEGMKYASAWSSRLGISYQMTGAALGALNEAGLRAGLGGRNLRAMMTNLAEDLESINEKLERGGSNLDTFFVEGKFDLIGFLEAIKENNPTLEDLQWYFKTFNTQGATALLYLTQMTDRLRELTEVQTGDVNDLIDSWGTAQDNIASYLQLVKNALMGVLQESGTLDKMRELAKDLASGKLDKVVSVLRKFIEKSIEWARSGGMDKFVAMFEALVKVLRPIARLAVMISNAFGWMFDKGGTLLVGILLVISRLTKMNTVLHQLIASYASLRLMQSGGAITPRMMGLGQLFGFGHVLPTNYAGMVTGAGIPGTGNWMESGVGITGAAAGVMKGGAAATTAQGGKRLLGRGLFGGVGAMSMGGSLALLGITSAAMLAMLAYQAKVAGDQRVAEREARLREKYSVNINGPIYGFNDFDRAVREADTYAYEDAKRYL